MHSRHTLEGEYIPLEQLDLNLDLRNDSDRLFLVTPQTICHPIDKDSPLWDLREKDLEHAEFEVKLSTYKILGNHWNKIRFAANNRLDSINSSIRIIIFFLQKKN